MVPTVSALGLVLVVLGVIGIRSKLPQIKLFGSKNTSTVQEIDPSTIELAVRKVPNERKVKEQVYSKR
jgi:hypothetical protein